MAEFLDVRNPDGTVTGETVEKKLKARQEKEKQKNGQK